jgi:hypothetical protein
MGFGPSTLEPACSQKLRSSSNGCPTEPDTIVWGSLLSACREHKNADMAKLAAEKLLSIDPDNSGAYSALANVYSACGRWNDAARIWKLRKDKTVKKETGFQLDSYTE